MGILLCEQNFRDVWRRNKSVSAEICKNLRTHTHTRGSISSKDMYDGSTTVVRCAVGVTEGFEVKVGLHQGSALSPCLFAMVMDRMTDDIREEAPWTMMFADDIVICSESKEQVEETGELEIMLWREEG